MREKRSMAECHVAFLAVRECHAPQSRRRALDDEMLFHLEAASMRGEQYCESHAVTVLARFREEPSGVRGLSLHVYGRQPNGPWKFTYDI
jgi:hypothetical protein